MLKRLFDILLLLLIAQTVWAQRLIRSCSRYYVEEQALPQRVEPLLRDAWSQYMLRDSGVWWGVWQQP